jgi:hypothetical protein
MAHGHSLTTHQIFVYIYHSKTKVISFTTHPLDIAYYVLIYHITLWFLFSSSCQTWWWPYNKRAEICCLSSDSYILIKFCCVLSYPPYQLRYCNSHTTEMNHLKTILISVTLVLPKWMWVVYGSARKRKYLIVVMKNSQHVLFQGSHDCLLTNACANETQRNMWARARTGESLSILTPCNQRPLHGTVRSCANTMAIYLFNGVSPSINKKIVHKEADIFVR